VKVPEVAAVPVCHLVHVRACPSERDRAYRTPYNVTSASDVARQCRERAVVVLTVGRASSLAVGLGTD
jgi:hypothetical protein